ncbi:MAG: hypothetical protein RLZZ230_534 [Candidatus Parcubacteria bacterium]|jgi:hypothetical protein
MSKNNFDAINIILIALFVFISDFCCPCRLVVQPVYKVVAGGTKCYTMYEWWEIVV